jgi:hypothetical protein
MRPAMVSLIIGGGLAVLAGWYFFTYQEKVVVQILAPLEIELALPVYEQFTVTQKVWLPVLEEIISLEMPIYIPAEAEKVQISLWSGEGKNLSSWKAVEVGKEIQELRLNLDKPMLAEGEIEVRVEAPEVGFDRKEEAPRVFVEFDDAAYPEGNFRIANNEKKGDMGLKLIGHQRRWQQWLTQWQVNPLQQGAAAGYWLLAALLVIDLPYVLLKGYKQ